MSGAGGQNKHGPYHRLRSPTQTEQTARLQLAGGEVWGRPSVWSNVAAVKAYRGPLALGDEGVEFLTDTAPSPGNHPTFVFWYDGAPGVTMKPANGQVFAVILVRVTAYRYL